MSDMQDYVSKGAPLEGIPVCSLTEYLVPKIRSLQQDKTIEVDADTGSVQTVGELMATSVRLAKGLENLGVKQNDVVGLMCRNCFEASQVVLGTWLRGATIAPVPGTMTASEYKHNFGITKPKVIFCEEEAVSSINEALNALGLPAKVILVGNTKHSTFMKFQEVLGEDTVENYKPLPAKSPSSELAAILSSSGTSGLPKGVGISHKNLIFQDFNMNSLDVLNIKGGMLQISHFFWVTGVIMFFRALTTGITRILMRNPIPLNCLKAIDRYKTESSMASPLFALSIALHPDFEKYDVSSMKTFLVGGSPLIPSIDQKLKEKWPEVKIIQLYGTTEVSGTIFFNNSDDNPSALGKITAGVQAKVVDRTTGKALKPNTLGEILLKTPGLMACYVGNEKAYEEAVEPDGWFHTGDVGYYDDSGLFYIVDRVKEMVKIRDMQVAPSELENVIMSIPGVIEVGVSGVSHGGNVYELIALIVKDKNSTVTADDVHTRIGSTLSEYKKLTGGVYFVESLPKTPTGKINKSKVRILAQNLYSGQ